MASSINNIITRGLSGKLGQFIFRRWYGKTVLTIKAARYNKKSALQVQRQLLFRQAIAYAKTAISDPSLFKFYSSKTKGAQRPYNVAISDFLSPPVIHEVDLSRYDGSIGSTIKALVTDNGRVAQVNIRIEKPDGSLIEKGEAVMLKDGIHWVYTTTISNNSPSVLIIEALDLAGRISEKRVGV